MEQITAETKTGWTKEFPSVLGFYFVRTEQYRELPAEFDGQAVSGLYGTRFFPDDLAHHHPEFLGPFTVSDTEQLIRLREEALQGICVYCGEVQQYESLEQKSGEEGNRIRVEHIKQCAQRPELKLIAYCEELQEAAKAAHGWIARVSNQYFLGADDPHDVLARLNAVLNPKPSAHDADELTQRQQS